MTCILIDDEPDCLALLSLMIRRYCPELIILGQYDRAQAGITAIHTMHPDLVFLDVEMPETNGFGVLEACKETPFQVIFTTAFNEYAVRAIRYSALGYLLKPIDQEDLKEAVARARQRVTIHQQAQQRDILFDFLHPTKPKRERIALAGADGTIFLPILELIYCEADGNYTKIFCADSSKPIVFSKSLKYMEEMLPAEAFFRPHHSYLIQLKQVTRLLNKDGDKLKMSNDAIIPVARNRKEELILLLSKL